MNNWTLRSVNLQTLVKIRKYTVLYTYGNKIYWELSCSFEHSKVAAANAHKHNCSVCFGVGNGCEFSVFWASAPFLSGTNPTARSWNFFQKPRGPQVALQLRMECIHARMHRDGVSLRKWLCDIYCSSGEPSSWQYWRFIATFNKLNESVRYISMKSKLIPCSSLIIISTEFWLIITSKTQLPIGGENYPTWRNCQLRFQRIQSFLPFTYLVSSEYFLIIDFMEHCLKIFLLEVWFICKLD